MRAGIQNRQSTLSGLSFFKEKRHNKRNVCVFNFVYFFIKKKKELITSDGTCGNGEILAIIGPLPLHSQGIFSCESANTKTHTLNHLQAGPFL